MSMRASTIPSSSAHVHSQIKICVAQNTNSCFCKILRSQRTTGRREMLKIHCHRWPEDPRQLLWHFEIPEFQVLIFECGGSQCDEVGVIICCTMNNRKGLPAVGIAKQRSRSVRS